MLGDGHRWGLDFSLVEQTEPHGLADAFLVGREFISDCTLSLILGDNIFFGHGLPAKLRAATELTEGTLIFTYTVREPQRYGVVAFDREGDVTSIKEKPEKHRSNIAVPGLYS